MNDDSIFLASAYLDGDVSAAERATVDSDPAMLELVAQLRQVRAMVADVGTPSISMREAHLAAALGAWDRLPDAERSGVLRDATPKGIDSATAAAAASITRATSTLGDRRRARSNRWMLGAAAALVVVLGGGIALRTLVDDRGSNDDQMATFEADTDGDIEASSAGGSAEAELQQEAGSPTDDAADETADMAMADAPTESLLTDPGPPPSELDLEELLSREQLAIFASDAVGAPLSATEPAATSAPADGAERAEFEFTLCGPVDFLVGPALYLGEFVVVGIDENRNLALAHLVDDCTEVARVPLP
jgi:hypothetical protein